MRRILESKGELLRGVLLDPISSSGATTPFHRSVLPGITNLASRGQRNVGNIRHRDDFKAYRTSLSLMSQACSEQR
jgi:hypothetical protein